MRIQTPLGEDSAYKYRFSLTIKLPFYRAIFQSHGLERNKGYLKHFGFRLGVGWRPFIFPPCNASNGKTPRNSTNNPLDRVRCLNGLVTLYSPGFNSASVVHEFFFSVGRGGVLVSSKAPFCAVTTTEIQHSGMCIPLDT